MIVSARTPPVNARRGPPSRPRILIVGANFAGLAAAQQLGREFAVTVIDRSPWFEWLPNVHELLSGAKTPGDLRLPRQRLVSRAGHRFVRAEVRSIEPRRGRATTTTGRHFDFDACIVAVGGVDQTFGVRGVERNALSLDGVAGCAAIGRRLAALARGARRTSVVIVGGGFEGVEALGEVLRREPVRGTLEVAVVEAGPRLMPGLPAKIDATVRAHCAEFPVRFMTGARVSAVTPRRVQLASGEALRSDLTIWTGGIAPPPALHGWGLARRPGQWAAVKPTLQSTRFANVFVAGDAAGLPWPLPKQAYHALDLGRCAADNAARLLTGRRLRRFVPVPRPVLIAFGTLDTFLVAGRTVVASPALAVLKESVFQLTMAQLDPPLGSAPLRDAWTRLGHAARSFAPPGLSRPAPAR
jgi:NADH dehydrogenase